MWAVDPFLNINEYNSLSGAEKNWYVYLVSSSINSNECKRIFWLTFRSYLMIERRKIYSSRFRWMISGCASKRNTRS